MKRDAIDFHAIPERQAKMHERLENWARSQFGGFGASASPMFRLYKSDEVWYAPMATVPVDHQDAAKIARGVHALPEPHMRALDWHYVNTCSPLKIRRTLACTAEALARYVIDGRDMLINRRV